MSVAAMSRLVHALWALKVGQETAFLTYPLGVAIPLLAFGYVLRIKDIRSQEGVLMQLGTALHLILIVAVPFAALHLALGFPVVFWLVEMFETKTPKTIRNQIRQRFVV
ncbi:MAG: hypothetical protein AAF668_02680 [Pseudomonadota bacterium]